MNSEFKNFLTKISLVALIFSAIGTVVFSRFLTEYYLPIYWGALVFFYVLTLAFYAWQLNVAKKNMAKFTRLNMVVTFLKLAVYSAFTVICLAISSKNALSFVVVVVILYVVFTVVEVTSLAKFVRSQNKNPDS